MIAFQGVSKYYDNLTVTAIREVTFTVQKGEMAFITGPSGAGKSTILRLIYLSEHPDRGDIVIGNFHLASLKKSKIPFLRRNIGIVFQDFKLINTLTIFDNVAMPLRIKKTNKQDIKHLVLESLKKVYLQHKSNSYPQSLSGGEQQRVVIARAIVANPLLILADEPTGNLDQDTATDIIRLFRNINIQGATVLIATHNKMLFRHTGKRVLKLDNGNLVGEEVN